MDDASTLILSIEKDNSYTQPKVFSFGLCFHTTGGIMSIDLRHKFLKDDKIVMLNKKIGEYKKPLIIDYHDDNNYYEIPVSHFELNN